MNDTERREALLAAERAAEWLRKLSDGGPDVHREFGRWLRQSPHHVREILLAAAHQHALRHMKGHHPVDVAALKAHCALQPSPIAAAKIEATASSNVRSLAGVLRPVANRWNKLQGRRRMKLAAVLAFVAIASVMGIAIDAVSERTISTGPGEWQTAKLVDGTTLYVGPWTRVRVDITDRKRVLYLAHGEVMVYVAKDPAHPFFIKTELATARAIGTAFAVQSIEPDRVSITVKEGLVSVSRESAEIAPSAARSDHQSIVVKAGERTDVVRDGAPLHPKAANLTRELAWVHGKLVLNGTIAEAIHEFNLRNRTQIQLLDPQIGQRRLVGVLDISDPAAFAKMLAAQVPNAIVEDERGTLVLSQDSESGSRESEESVIR